MSADGGGGAGRRVFADIGGSLVITFDICEGVTKGDATKGRRNEAKYALPSSSLLIGFQEVVSRDARLCANRSQS